MLSTNMHMMELLANEQQRARERTFRHTTQLRLAAAEAKRGGAPMRIRRMTAPMIITLLLTALIALALWLPFGPSSRAVTALWLPFRSSSQMVATIWLPFRQSTQAIPTYWLPF